MKPNHEILLLSFTFMFTFTTNPKLKIKNPKFLSLNPLTP